ncbi:hypothetical protein ACWDSD_35240 [Streptomyces spiralis]
MRDQFGPYGRQIRQLAERAIRPALTGVEHRVRADNQAHNFPHPPAA